ncbi:hypothetical protein Micbo1qcDRAFT_164908 [Microdochium bolleyi]|uniref:Uncharacterized protein n=1 Tax=Microdochium bolleyi TaxID=196109 RepID=A0A136IXI9_9PEZI|nr:hypothetical protein Micbo1qcDRAFT_164908 [Microdochium bolleyi]
MPWEDPSPGVMARPQPGPCRSSRMIPRPAPGRSSIPALQSARALIDRSPSDSSQPLSSPSCPHN